MRRMMGITGYVSMILSLAFGLVAPSSGWAQVNLTQHDSSDAGPAWSPDGTKIAFVSTRGGSASYHNIYVMDANGDNPVLLGGGECSRVVTRRDQDCLCGRPRLILQ